MGRKNNNNNNKVSTRSVGKTLTVLLLVRAFTLTVQKDLFFQSIAEEAYMWRDISEGGK